VATTDQEHEPSSDAPCEQGAGCVKTPGIVIAVALALAATILLIYALIAIWPETRPPAAAGAAPRPEDSIHFLGWVFTLSSDARLFLVVAVAGALGGLVHTLRSLSWYVGNRYMKWSWVPFYLIIPFIAAGLATIFYLVLRAGLFTSTTMPTDTNAYGFAALAALVGAFSEQALEKLREVFSLVLAHAPQGLDTAAGPKPEAVTGVAENVSPTSAILTGTVRPLGNDTDVEFSYGLTLAYGQTAKARKVAASEKAAAIKMPISGLTPGTTYHYRIEASNAAGKGIGEDATFKTEP
jgi:hypothetical protein